MDFPEMAAKTIEELARSYKAAKKSIAELEEDKARAEDKNTLLSEHGKPPNTEDVEHIAYLLSKEREKLAVLREQIRLTAVMLVHSPLSTEGQA